MSADVNLDHLRETVIILTEWGWYVFPLAPGKKTPITPNGYKDATNDTAIALHKFNHGKLNIGVATGPSGLVVLDVDGEQGSLWLTDMQTTFGLPKTFAVQTRSGGCHLYFTAPPGITIKSSASKIAPNIDIRSAGGYVVGPTSWVDADNKGPAGWYRVIDQSTAAPLPEWLLKIVVASQTPPRQKPCATKVYTQHTNPETPRSVATLKELLNHIDADCDYEIYRAVIWGILSTGWSCAATLAHEWSLSAPERFEQSTFDALINSHDPERPGSVSYGTLMYLARRGGYRG
jgi:hypothetical protein